MTDPKSQSENVVEQKSEVQLTPELVVHGQHRSSSRWRRWKTALSLSPWSSMQDGEEGDPKQPQFSWAGSGFQIRW